MIINDFISNSSSCSFILSKIPVEELDLRIIRIFQRLNIITFLFDKSLKEDIDNIIKCANKDKEKIVFGAHQPQQTTLLYEVIIYNPYQLQLSDINTIKRLCQLCMHIDCNCDDYDDETLANATQICTMLECFYPKIKVEADDMFDYESIKKILNIKGENDD